MTTLRKLISEIDFNNKQLEVSPNWEDLTKTLNLEWLPWSEDKRLKAFFIKTWYCTDSWVGTRAYFLDGEFVAISNQVGRKWDEDFGFVSKEAGFKVKNYLETLISNSKDINFDIFEDFDSEIPETYKIEYSSQILHKTALYEGREVKIIKSNYPHGTDDYFHTVLIEINKGQQRKVNIKELNFKYNTL